MAFLSRWLLSTIVIFLAALIATLGFDEVLEFLLDAALKPWKDFCQWMLPDSWFTLGNITLGLAVIFWVFSFVVPFSVHSLLLSGF